MLHMMRKFKRNQAGVTAIEYGLIAALVGVFIIGGLKVLGPALSTAFSTVGTTVQSAMPTTTPPAAP